MNNFDANLETIKEMTDPLQEFPELRQEIIDFVGGISETLDNVMKALEIIKKAKERE